MKPFSKIIALAIVATYIFSPISTIWAQSAPQSPDQRLKNQRAEDQIQCLEKKPSRNQANQNGTLSNLLAEAFKENLANSIESFFSNELGPRIQERIDQLMPKLIQSGLNQRLPKYVDNKIYNSGGVENITADQLKAITEQGIKEITADIIRERTPQITDYVLENDFPQYVAESFGDTTTGVIYNEAFVQRVKEAVDVMDRMLQEAQVEAFVGVAKAAKGMVDSVKYLPQATVEAARNGDPFSIFENFQSVAEQGKQIQAMVDEASKMRLTQEQKDEMVRIILEEMAAAGREAVLNDPNILGLTNSISGRVSNLVNTDISDSFISDIGDLVGRNDYNQIINSHINDGTLSLGGIDITGPNGDLTSGLAGDLFNPMVADMAPIIGQWTYGFTNGLISSNSFSFAGAVANNPGATIMVNGFDYSSGGSLGKTWQPYDPSVHLPLDQYSTDSVRVAGLTEGSIRWEEPTSILPADFVGPPAPGDIFAPEAAIEATNQTVNEVGERVGGTAATQGASNAAAKIGASEVFKGMGTAFINAVPGMVGGLVGSLASNIPVVGGLIGPIAGLATTYAITALFGIGGATIGFLVADIGLNLSVGMGFDGVGKAISEVIKNTGKSNQNEEVANQYLESVTATNLQACTYEKSSNRVMLSLEKLFYIQLGDSNKANYVTSVELNRVARDYLRQSRTVATAPGASEGKNKQPAVVSPEQISREGREAAANKVTNQASENPNWNIKNAGITLTRLNQIDQNDELKSRITEQQANNLESFTERQKLDGITFWDQFREKARAGKSATLVAIMNRQVKAQNDSEKFDLTELMANNGMIGTRTNGVNPAGYPEGEAKIGTSGSMLFSWFSRMFNLPFDFLTVPVNNSDFVGPLVGQHVAQISNLSDDPNTNQVAQQAQRIGSDPCPGPEPCPNSGLQSGQINPTAINRSLENGSKNDSQIATDQMFDDLINGEGVGDDGSINNDDFVFPEFDTTPKITYFRLSEDGSKIEWWTNFVYQCRAKNDWVGTNTKTNDTLNSVVGSLDIVVPLVHSGLTYTIECLDSNNQPVSKELAIPTTQ